MILTWNLNVTRAVVLLTTTNKLVMRSSTSMTKNSRERCVCPASSFTQFLCAEISCVRRWHIVFAGKRVGTSSRGTTVSVAARMVTHADSLISTPHRRLVFDSSSSSAHTTLLSLTSPDPLIRPPQNAFIGTLCLHIPLMMVCRRTNHTANS